MCERPDIVPIGHIPELGVGPGVDDYEVGLIGAPRPGLRNLEETRAAASNG